MSELYATHSDDGVPLEDLEGQSDAEERLQAALWADCKPRHHYYADHNGRPVQHPDPVCKWLDHLRGVKARFPSILQTSGGPRVNLPDPRLDLPGSKTIYTLTLKILVVPGASAKVQREIVAALKAFKHSQCHWSKRDDGPIWIFTDREEFRTAG